jgi:hypothetical protein
MVNSFYENFRCFNFLINLSQFKTANENLKLLNHLLAQGCLKAIKSIIVKKNDKNFHTTLKQPLKNLQND